MIEIKELLRLWLAGLSLRELALRTGLDRKTVRRYLDLAQQLGLQRSDPPERISDDLLSSLVLQLRPGHPPPLGAMRELCLQHRDLLQEWSQQGCRGPKLVRLLQRHTGVAVPLRTLQRFVQETLAPEDTSTVRIVPSPPGLLEIDFLTLGDFHDLDAQRLRTLHALLLTAACSRHQFLWPCLSQTLDDLLEGLEAAWEFFGGVFPVLLPDNLKAVVSEADPLTPVFQRDFLEYSQARGFLIDPARVRKPKDKAHVERQVRYVRDDFFAGESFSSLAVARIAARRWCLEQAGMRIHGHTRLRPLEAFEAQEKSHLLPPPTEPYDTPRWTELQVGRDHALVVEYSLYSVPFRLEGQTLQVRWDRQSVKFYQGGELVKVHPRQPRGGSRIDPVDLPPGKAALATRDAQSLCQQAQEMGEHLGEYARRLAEGPLPWTRMRHIYHLLGLARHYGPSPTNEACGRALELEVVEVRRIERMLEQGLRARSPVTAPPPPAPRGQVLRFARPASAFRLPEGGGDVPA